MHLNISLNINLIENVCKYVYYKFITFYQQSYYFVFVYPFKMVIILFQIYLYIVIGCGLKNLLLLL